MAQPIIAPIPNWLDIGPGFTLRVTALDPTTGNVVSGVNVGTVTIQASGSGDLSSGSFTVGNPILIGTGL